MAQEIDISLPESDVEDEAAEAEASPDALNVPRYTISSYGVDYPLDALYKRLTSRTDGELPDIFIPDFQRGYVWTKRQADRFIESLLLGLPVPGIFLSRDEKTKKLFVIDGAQRLRTIKFFIDNDMDGKEFVLNRVNDAFDGKSYEDLSAEDRRQFDDYVIHATVVKQDLPEEDNTSIYHLFDRINTGGTAAQPHEIRRSLFGGTFNDLIEDLNDNKDWRSVYGRRSKRMKDQELILRFLALLYNRRNYSGTMKNFLTDFMGRNREIDGDKSKQYRRTFEDTIRVAYESVGEGVFRPRGAINVAVFDSVMVGIAARLGQGEIDDLKGLRKHYRDLLRDREYEQATQSGTSQQNNVRLRLSKAIQAFSDRR